MFKRSFWRACTSFVLAASLICSSVYVPASAASTTDMKNEISELEEKSAKLEKEIAQLKKDKAEQNTIKKKLDQQIAVTQEKISACTRLISTLR